MNHELEVATSIIFFCVFRFCRRYVLSEITWQNILTHRRQDV